MAELIVLYPLSAQLLPFPLGAWGATHKVWVLRGAATRVDALSVFADATEADTPMNPREMRAAATPIRSLRICFSPFKGGLGTAIERLGCPAWMTSTVVKQVFAPHLARNRRR